MCSIFLNFIAFNYFDEKTFFTKTISKSKGQPPQHLTSNPMLSRNESESALPPTKHSQIQGAKTQKMSVWHAHRAVMRTPAVRFSNY